MRFELYCNDTEEDFRKAVDEIHNDKDSLFNFEESCRLWYTQNGETVLVEHQVSTGSRMVMCELPDVEDWITVYEVDNEEDYNAGDEIWTESVDANISLKNIKEKMLEVAKSVFE